MSKAAASVARAVAWPAAGLGVWAAHFGAIYAIHAFACERGFAGEQLFGIPWVMAMILGVTILALLMLGLLFWLGYPGGALTQGGEAEPRFTLWFGAIACVVSAFAVVFQAAPAMVLPPCS
ncbi:hypothetical protein J8J14_06505 [Roseomonas sp. SSH11]|uniref:Uncharacterized protein n=1 Tax=Pararoseomonas baculiformis TaxID=2820812 RepID=A0ABS4ABP0_9PROT|nr:hypothetical protein [Pararoseomonas baculiformis]MBP0444427.1 hypothetical protein [Pararoseomonas baculiformis]